MRPTTANRFFRADNDGLPALFLFVAVLLIFSPAIFNGFTTYDDPEYVTANAYVQSGLTFHGIAWAFRAHGANWHPLTWLTHILDGQLYGLRPWGHHLGNVLLHAFNTVLAFRVLKKLTGYTARSFAAALLFGLHPLRVESVAWVAERKDVLSVFFCLLTLLAYTVYVRQSGLPVPNQRRKYFALALGMFALGLLSKSMLVTLPCVLLLLDFWPLARFQTRTLSQLALEKVPFFLLTAGMSLIAYFAQYHGTAMVSALPLRARVANALISYGRYLGKIFWPANLCALYPYPPAWPVTLVCAAAALLGLITLFSLLQIRQRPYVAMGWFWFLGTLVPVIGLVQIGNQSIADRYTYLPSLGIIIAAVWGVADLTKNWPRRTTILATTTAALASVCSVLTVKQIGYWKDSEAMYRRAVAVTSDNTLALIGLGSTLAARGDGDDAIRLYRQAIKLSPHYYEAHFNLGLALMDKGQLDDAITEFRTAMICRPRVADSNLSLGVVLDRKGATAEAITQFEEAAAIDPANVAAHANLGKIYVREKNFTAAIGEFQLAVKLRPDDSQLHYDLASALVKVKRFDEAVTEYRAALKFTPDNPEIHNDLGITLAVKGDLVSAIQEFQTALKLNPQYPLAAANLTKVLQMQSQPDKYPPGKK